MLTLVTREENVVVAVELAKTNERAARRAATAKKAGRVAAEAAKFEEKEAWQRPSKQDYLLEKAMKEPYVYVGYHAHEGHTVINTSKKYKRINKYDTDMVSLDEVLLAIVKADYLAIAAETAERLFPRYGWRENYPTETELIRSITRPDVEAARDTANELGREWECFNGSLPVIDPYKYFGQKRLAKLLSEDRPQWVRDTVDYEIDEAYDFDLDYCY